ncbi:MAG: hypoxanthine phosphoribosyltransferase [Firmicutes bacterium]|nr:hypoxanthine phosphoribosyltransferase [Bacillota bacterium]
MHPDLQEIILSEEQIQRRVAELGRQITRDYQDRHLLTIGILRGAVIFLADLIRHLDLPVAVDFMAVSSYGQATASSGVVRILKDLDETVTGRHVLLVEDIIDTGLTLSYLVDNLRSRRPASLRICTLLDKPSRRKVEITPDYNGFTIPDRFVVGYGLDYAENYRQLPYIGVLKPEVYRR